MSESLEINDSYNWYDCEEKERKFWKEYLDSAFPFDPYGTVSFIEEFAFKIDTSKKSLLSITEKINDTLLK